MVRLGSVPEDTKEGLRFLQNRIAFFGGVLFALASGFYIVNVGMVLFMHEPQIGECLIGGGRVWHLAACFAILAMWLVARQKRTLSAPTLACLDTLGVADIGLAFAAMAFHIGNSEGIFIGLLALTNTALARAIMVPSTARRTAFITAIAMAPILPTTFYGAWRGSIAAPASEEGGLVGFLVNVGLWVVASTVTATLASKIIYGLQEKVREARQLGQYTLEKKIGEGGMGKVYIASHAMLRRKTAVKLMNSQADEQIERFEREVQLTAKLNHPNTISVFDYGRAPDGVFYYAMEYLDGINLEELVRAEGPQTPARVIHILRQVCGALSEAHGIGLIHRDIKPANIHLCRHGGIPDVVKVLDFGLVKDVSGGNNVAQSAANVLTGTPVYMSPEAITSSSTVDARSDLYALGAVGYFLLTGKTVFEGENLVEVCSHHLHSKPQRPSERGREVPDDLENVLLSCLAKDPEERPATARLLAASLAACADADTWTENNAQEWWDERGEPVKRASRAPGSSSSAADSPQDTLDIDLARRQLVTEALTAPGGE